ncbi:MAG: DUF2971 domain-containing protein [Gammaproteobacteria bacterium]|nr:MAG: DUF2971 domain-containing protein [Gammaproteobacteria bacterium]UTW43619.1 DUF2971 domain-containing protein [bacterium SCSIO 12844]
MEHLYKYLPILNEKDELDENLLKSILDGYIKFSQRTSFNDPNDCQIYIEDIMHNESKEFFESLINKYYIACFSKINDSVAMWSHYSKDHQGICLVYNKTALKTLLPQDIAQGEINYQSIPKIYSKSFFSDLRAHQAQENIFKYHCMNDMVENVFFKKSLDWLYEKEYRISFEISMIGKLKSKKLDNSYLIKLLPPIEIVLGGKCPETIIKEIEKIINQQKSTVSLGQAKLDHESYSMKIVPYRK